MSQLKKVIPTPRVVTVIDSGVGFKKSSTRNDGAVVQMLGPKAHDSWALPTLLQTLDGLKSCTPQRMSRWIRQEKTKPYRLCIGRCTVYIDFRKRLDVEFVPVRANFQLMFVPQPDVWLAAGLETLLSRASAGALSMWSAPQVDSHQGATHK